MVGEKAGQMAGGKVVSRVALLEHEWAVWWVVSTVAWKAALLDAVWAA